MTNSIDGMWASINTIYKQFICNREDIVGIQLNGWRFQMGSTNGLLYVYHLENNNWNLKYSVMLKDESN